jgi:2-methylisocitrate lyase-like PEP mutase family enzyme
VAAMRKAADEAGIPLAINARTDPFLLGLGDNDEWRFEESVRRGKLYANAGATSIFVPGVTDERTIERLVKAIGIPLNVLANASTPNVKRLAELGVARISTGSTSTGHAMAKFRSMADEVKQTGSFAFAAERIPHSEMNALFE